MELVLILTGLLVITAVVGVVMEGVLRRRDRIANRTPADHHPRCANCGYIVHGIAHHRCPECGANLRIVGRDWGGR
jgi:rRNA maturation endonuclease Nob1